MLDGKIFRAAVITPEAVTLEADVTGVKFPAHDGLMGILTHRAPLLTKMGTGILTLETTAGDRVYFVSGGYAQMKDNTLTILPNEAIAAADLTPARLQKERTAFDDAAGANTADLDRRQVLQARIQAMEEMLAAKV